MLTELQMNQSAFDLWISAENNDDFSDLERVKRILPLILEECCTEKQRKYIMHYFAEGMTIPQIAKLYSVNKSTVSRTIHRGISSAYSYLRFCSPLFIKTPKKRGYLCHQKWHKGKGTRCG